MNQDNRMMKMSNERLWCITAGGVLAVALLFPQTVSANGLNRSPHTEDTEQVVGILGIQSSEFENGKTGFGGGFGVFYEPTIIEGWLEIELNPSLLWAEGDHVVAVDMLLKKPFFVHDVINPYVGFGPAVVITIGEEETKSRFGLTAAVGSYFWPWEHFGLDSDLVYTAQLTRNVIHELTFQFGPVARF